MPHCLVYLYFTAPRRSRAAMWPAAPITDVRNGCLSQHDTSSSKHSYSPERSFQYSLPLPAIAGNKTGIGLFTSMSAKAFPRWISPLQFGPMVDQFVVETRAGIKNARMAGPRPWLPWRGVNGDRTMYLRMLPYS